MSPLPNTDYDPHLSMEYSEVLLSCEAAGYNSLFLMVSIMF